MARKAKADPRVAEAVAWLKKRGIKKNVDGMARYGIVATNPIGVSVGEVRTLAKRFGRDHALAHELWEAGYYETRLLTAFVADPAALTAREMDYWIGQCENWADVDTLCFACFDQSPLAWGRLPVWAKRKGEFEKRAAFALLASLALHAKQAPDVRFLKALPLIERAASDERNFVKKGVSWALRAMKRRGPEVRAKALALATKLAASDNATERWVGRDGLRDLGKTPKASKRKEK
jgi:3-methyladenine DNA glycosylase AlkD